MVWEPCCDTPDFPSVCLQVKSRIGFSYSEITCDEIMSKEACISTLLQEQNKNATGYLQ